MDIFNKRAKLYQKVFNSDEGKKVLADLYKITGVHTIPYVQGDIEHTHVNIGKQMIGYTLKALLNHDDKEVGDLVDSTRQQYDPFNYKE